jgi:ribosome-associated protein
MNPERISTRPVPGGSSTPENEGVPNEPLRVTGSLLIPAEELDWRFSRASGPGGQGVNTTDSRVQLRWDVAASAALTDQQRARLLSRLASRLVDGVVQVTAAETRSQRQNREAAQRRLAELVAAGLAPPPRSRRATKPTRGSVERRIAGKRRRSDVKRLRRDLGD